MLSLESAASALGSDRALALRYFPPTVRSAIAALFMIDTAMGDVLRTTREPMVGPIRLAWWRERLEELDSGVHSPGEPRLVEVERELLPRGITGHAISELQSGWLALFAPFPWGVETGEAIWMRGNRLFGLAARLTGERNEQIQAAGGLWALTDVARHCSDEQSRAFLQRQAHGFARGLAGAWFQKRLRPLSMLAALAIRDSSHGEPFEPEGTPGRAVTMIRHRLSGRLQRQ